jgi:serine/threonine protein kinase
VPSYRLTEKLEGGELAELYRAQRDGGVGSVVVKLFHERTSAKGYAQAIADTTNRLSQIFHPGICHVVDVGTIKRRLAIVREDSGKYTLGQVLQRLNTKEVVITSGLAMALVLDLIDAVAEAHGIGIVHGAMTPGNVLVSAEGRASVCDFGALSALNSVSALKKNFAARGRSAYRAPELLKGEGVTSQSDVYSLGAMTYELLTLRVATSDAAQVSVRRDALPPPSRLDRRLNSRIDPIIMRALDPAPGRRYRTTSEFGASLRDFLSANGGMPPRDELKRFVDQLFPDDVKLVPSTAVPFSDEFQLANVEGADLDAGEERSMVLTPRAAFSGSLEEMPAVVDPARNADVGREAITGPNDGPTPEQLDPERDRSTDWHAPVGAMPSTARSGPKESLNADVLKRVRRIEDFEGKKGPSAEDTLPAGMRFETAEDMPRIFPGRRDPSPTEKVETVALPADSQPISLESSIIDDDGKRRRMNTEERNIAKTEAAHRKWLPIVFAAGAAALAFLLLGIWKWSSSQLPPIEVPQYVEKPRPVKRPPPPPKKEKERDRDEPTRSVVENCYDGPRKGAPVGYLAVLTDRRVSVLVEGEAVCGRYEKIPVAAGTRMITVIDTRTKEQYEHATRIEAGKTFPLSPTFKGKR